MTWNLASCEDFKFIILFPYMNKIVLKWFVHLLTNNNNPIKLDVLRCEACYIHLITQSTCYE